MKKITTEKGSKVTPYEELLRSRKELINDNASQYGEVEHQLEFVAVVNGVTFVNDSRSSDVNSTWYALNKMNSPVVWIAGGVDKDNDYELLMEMVKDKVKCIICIGEDNTNLVNAFHKEIPLMISRADKMSEAVEFARITSTFGDVVLLSPGCPAYDRFVNYENRGNEFKSAVEHMRWKTI
jgi:UDP-N-acetylmuramoylalanine--D-glutamate ligase